MDWKDFNHDGHADGRMVLARFPTGPIECHCELDGFYTRDDRLITDSLGHPAIPGCLAADRARRRMTAGEGIAHEMRLFDDEGKRLYLTADERARFLKASANEEREDRLFCRLLHFSGCRPSEALELTPERISLDERAVVFRSLKKRKKDQRGRVKRPQFRTVPLPDRVVEELDLVFNLRRKRKPAERRQPLWTMSRTTAWRLVQRVMDRAGIEGPQASAKGLRHGFGIAMLSGDRPLPINVLRDLLGHTDTKTTEIYLQAIGQERRNLVMQAWGESD